MRLSSVISSLILVAAGALGAYGWIMRPAEIGATTPASGMDILRAYECRRGETKSIIVRGVEDNHSPAGEEPIFIREGRRNPDVQSYFTNGSYDQVQPDRRLTDSFRAPSNTASGLFLLRLKSVGDNQNDTLAIGDLTAMTRAGSRGDRFGKMIADLSMAPGWSREGEYYFGEFDSIRLQEVAADGRLKPTVTLLSFIRAGAAEGWVDYTVQDDTSVDFVGIALCLEPAPGKGLTLSPFKEQLKPLPGVVALTCFFGGQNEQMCDPYVGDTACSSQLPVACIRPDGRPVPKALIGHNAGTSWSGGQLAFTEPVAGSRFANFRQVDSFCAAQFGTGWRTARWHDGTSNSDIAGRTASISPQSRVWIDIADSPYATCWAR